MPETAHSINVRVVLALKQEAREVAVQLPAGASARDAVRAALDAGLSLEGVDFDVETGPVGIHGRRVSDQEAVLDGDRVELYRALEQDPMERRRRIAAGD